MLPILLVVFFCTFSYTMFENLDNLQNFNKEAISLMGLSANDFWNIGTRTQSTEEIFTIDKNRNTSENELFDVNKKVNPFLHSDSVKPYIREGIYDKTNSYKQVGAIVLKGEIHCTGTLIGKRTVLTAAHCIYKNESYFQNGQDVQFILGRNFRKPDAVRTVINYSYPQKDDQGYKYDPETHEDDIGILTLKDKFEDIDPYLIHFDDPDWQKIINNPIKFVGYGYNYKDGQPVGIGWRRWQEWKVSSLREKEFWYENPKASTCQGDSGGPALWTDDSGTVIVVGVTSRGDNECKRGKSTKVNFYKKWLEPKVI